MTPGRLIPFASLVLPILVFAGSCAEETADVPQGVELIAVVQSAMTSPVADLRAESIRLATIVDIPDLQIFLRRALEDDSPLVRTAALNGLLTRGEESAEGLLLRRLAEGSLEQRKDAFLAGLNFGTSRFQTQLMNYAAREGATMFRQLVVERFLLGDLDYVAEPSEAFLVRAVSDNPERAQALSARLLERGHAATRRRVLGALLSEQESERISAIRVLINTPLREAWPRLRWLFQTKSGEEQTLAATALLRLGDRSGMELLTTLWRRGGDTAPEAVLARAEFLETQDRAQLSALLANPDPFFRRAALEALLGLGLSRDELLEVVEDVNPDLTNLATRLSLRQMGVDEIDQLCSRLSRSERPAQLLRVLWVYAEEGGTMDQSACDRAIAGLLDSEDTEVSSIAARIHYQTVPPSLEDFELAKDYPGWLLAILEYSLAQDGEQYADIYRELLGHELQIVRAGAAMGLLREEQRVSPESD
ncbi:MAG: HEAT repeat domain-containing protein [Myxococcales bacterium]|nr:HEAT repeat domain-containing protein [Myxococcales bacterium]